MIIEEEVVENQQTRTLLLLKSPKMMMPSVGRQELASACVCAKSLQLCQTLCDRTDCSLPGSSVSGIFQARILVWVAISFSRESSRPRDRT